MESPPRRSQRNQEPVARSPPGLIKDARVKWGRDTCSLFTRAGCFEALDDDEFMDAAGRLLDWQSDIPRAREPAE